MDSDDWAPAVAQCPITRAMVAICAYRVRCAGCRNPALRLAGGGLGKAVTTSSFRARSESAWAAGPLTQWRVAKSPVTISTWGSSASRTAPGCPASASSSGSARLSRRGRRSHSCRARQRDAGRERSRTGHRRTLSASCRRTETERREGARRGDMAHAVRATRRSLHVAAMLASEMARSFHVVLVLAARGVVGSVRRRTFAGPR
jgi:hypothetical protein